MKCPACGNELTRMEVGPIIVDVCKNGCGGVWFDKHELNKVDEAHEEEGKMLVDIEKQKSIAIDKNKKRHCPKCSNIVMMRHYFTVKKQIEIDECPGCGGIWLDAGELAAIRILFETEGDRKKAAQDYFDKEFGKEIQEIEGTSKERLKSRRKFAKVLRFLCPSYYIPGDQDWGAY